MALREENRNNADSKLPSSLEPSGVIMGREPGVRKAVNVEEQAP